MIKSSVDLSKAKPVLGILYPIVKGIYEKMGYECRITSGCEEARGRLPHSKHYSGEALDFGLKHIPSDSKPGLVLKIKTALGPQFDVVWKFPDGDNEHLHIEFDPK